MGEEKDGRIILTFLNNDLEVLGDFFPSIDDGSPISLRYMDTLYAKSNITYGVQHDEIRKAYRACVENREIVRNVLIAKGEPPVSEVPEHLRMNPHLIPKNKPRGKNEKVDHRARSPFIIVKQGQTLAKLKPFKPGKDGTDVHGQRVPYTLTKPHAIIAGENTQMENEYLVSQINGQLVQIKGELSVRNTLVIKGSVGYATGNIVFPGDVQIGGSVSDGFKIHSGGSIIIKQTFDVTDAITKKDLKVAGGIIGRGKALIKVGGCVKTIFIENCHLAAREDIYVETEIINSTIFTFGSVEMGEKSRIVGGEVYAVKGIRTGGLGKKTGKAARIYCGVDFTLEEEKKKYNSIMRMLAAKIKRLKEILENPVMDSEKIKSLIEQYKEEQQKAQNRVTELLGKLNIYEDAAVEVTGEIVAGTLIEICQVTHYITEPLNNVKIHLGRESQKLVITKLSS